MKKNIIEKLNKLNVVARFKHALNKVNEKRDTDTTNATIAFDLRDKIKQMGRLNGLNIYFDEHSRLILKTDFGIFKISSYNNKKRQALQNDDIPETQLSLFEGKDNPIGNQLFEIGIVTNKSRRKFEEIFFKYKAQNDTNYFSSLLKEASIEKFSTEKAADTSDYIPEFAKPKKQKERKDKEA